MIKDITFFSPRDIESVTGLSRDELRNKGFNLDDMDFGFVFDDDAFGSIPFYIRWLIFEAESCCCGYNYVEYDGRHWYTVHHA